MLQLPTLYGTVTVLVSGNGVHLLLLDDQVYDLQGRLRCLKDQLEQLLVGFRGLFVWGFMVGWVDGRGLGLLFIVGLFVLIWCVCYLIFMYLNLLALFPLCLYFALLHPLLLPLPLHPYLRYVVLNHFPKQCLTLVSNVNNPLNYQSNYLIAMIVAPTVLKNSLNVIQALLNMSIQVFLKVLWNTGQVHRFLDYFVVIDKTQTLPIKRVSEL